MEQKLEARLRPMQGRVAGMILMLAVASGRVSAQTHNYAYVALHDRNRIAVLDADTGGLDANIPVGREPIDVAFSPDRTRAYVANSFSGTVSIINVLTQEPIGAVDVGAAVGAAPYAVATTPDGRFAYVATYAPDPPGGSDRLAVIDTVSVVGPLRSGALLVGWRSVPTAPSRM